MTDKAKHSTFSKYAKGLLSRPTTTNYHENRSLRTDALEAVDATDHKQNLCYTADSAISAFAVSPDNNQIVLAGREILKIVSIGRNIIAEVSNLRGGNRVNLQYSANDVKWGVGLTSAIIATATPNGSIVTWNVHTGLKRIERVIKGHNRAVNRLAFNPGNPAWLLSASQDGSMKLWDLRQGDRTARVTMHGKAEAVRDVQFNAPNGVELAAVYDNGTLQTWDLRYPTLYERKFNAHQGPALALDWHADGRHLATGGRDKLIKIWNLGSDSRKPVCDVHTMAPVARVAWRPGDSAETCQIASCSFSMDNTVVLWNLRRPFIPSRVIEAHDTVATGILWRDSECLWSCSKDQTFRQHVIGLAPSPVDLNTHCALGWSANGDAALCIGDSVADNLRMRSLERKQAQATSSDTQAESINGTSREVQPPLMSVFNPRVRRFIPYQSVGVVHAEDNSNTLLKHLASNYVTSKNNPIRACARNAIVAYRANLRRVSEVWKLLKLELEYVERIRKRYETLGPPPSRQASLASRSKLGESLIHRDLERLKSASVMSDSGHNTVRANSPAASLVMPRYSDSSLPPLSLPCSTVPSRPPTADIHADTSNPRKLTRPASVADGQHRTGVPGPPIAAKLEGINLTESWVSNLVAHHESESKNTSEINIGDRRLSSPILPYDGNDTARSIPQPIMQGTEDLESIRRTQNDFTPATVMIDSYYQGLRDLLDPTLEAYGESGDVQLCSTVCLVLADHIKVSSDRVDEWLYWYVDLLWRQKLFTIVAEVIKNTDSQFIKSMAEGDVITSTSCARCRKAVPLVREGAGRYWMCPRCQNTVRCILCLNVIKGETSWCPACTHAAHPDCRTALLSEFGARCVASDCDCQCNVSG